MRDDERSVQRYGALSRGTVGLVQSSKSIIFSNAICVQDSDVFVDTCDYEYVNIAVSEDTRVSSTFLY